MSTTSLVVVPLAQPRQAPRQLLLPIESLRIHDAGPSRGTLRSLFEENSLCSYRILKKQRRVTTNTSN